MTEYKVIPPTFEDFFKYQELAPKAEGESTFVADEFLLQNFLEPKPNDSIGFRERTKLLKLLQKTPDLSQFIDKDEFEFEGNIFTYVDPPGAYLYTFRINQTEKGQGYAVRHALETCYRVNGKPLKECAGELSFKAAQVLMANALSFFRD